MRRKEEATLWEMKWLNSTRRNNNFKDIIEEPLSEWEGPGHNSSASIDTEQRSMESFHAAQQ